MRLTLKYILVFALLFTACQPDKKATSLFELKVKETKITFENNLTYTEDFNPYSYRNFFNGGGVTLGDINNDGLLDIYFTGNLVDNKLYLNKGNFKFEDITDKAGVACKNVWSTGPTFVDINGDGLLDIYVCKSGKPGGANRHNELFINNGNLTFTEKSKEYGLDINGLSVNATFFDYDKDGDLDCYILSNSVRSIGAFDLTKDQRNIIDPNGNKFFKNENGKFVDYTKEAGMFSSKIGFGLSVVLGDFNGDDWTDIYVSNDFFERDYLYINNKKGGFDESLESYFKSISMGSMGADAADINNDLLPDIFVTEMLPRTIARKRTKAMYDNWNEYHQKVKQGYFNQFPRNVLQRNTGNNQFFEIGRKAGVAATDWSWSALIFDMDNDGLKDLFITNGIYKDLLDRDYLTYMANGKNVRAILKSKNKVVKKLIDVMPSKAIPNISYKNTGNFNFTNVTKKWGFNTPTFSNGCAYGDLNNDGTLDLVINNVNMPSYIYQNKTDTLQNKSISFKLKSKSKNTNAIGAKVIIKYGNGKQALVENYESKGYQSSISEPIHFGVGHYSKIDTLIIKWPNGAKTIKNNLVTNKKYTFKEPDNSPITTNIKSVKQNNILNSRAALFDFTHHENYFSDFNKEKLMPFMVNNEGPALADADINKDGITDFFVGGAKGQSGSLFISKPDGTYFKDSKPFLANLNSEDTDALFFDGDGDGDLDLFVCSGGKAFTSNAQVLADRYYINKGNGTFLQALNALPKNLKFSSSSVVAADFDNDGDLDIFIGERLKVKAYGLPCSGYLLENKSNNKFELSKQPALKNLGLITGAQFTDVNKDGWNDLIVVGEFMPITILINQNGTFVNQTKNYGLADSNGLWSSIKIADFDKDGNQDIIVGNKGDNNFFKDGLSMFVDDFDKNGSVEQLICYQYNGLDYPIVGRDELIAQLPYFKTKLLRFKDYQDATMTSLFNKSVINESKKFTANNFKTAIFLNKNGKFVNFELPPEIQYSSVKAIEINDVNNDGVMDIILGGNQYLVKPKFGRDDASKGWLIYGAINHDKYEFKSVNSLNIDGQIRGFKIIELNGKKILITAINNEKVQFNDIKNP